MPENVTEVHVRIVSSEGEILEQVLLDIQPIDPRLSDYHVLVYGAPGVKALVLSPSSQLYGSPAPQSG